MPPLPQDSSDPFEQAYALYKQQSYDEALSVLNKSADDVRFDFLRGQIFTRLDCPQAALTAYLKGAELDPSKAPSEAISSVLRSPSHIHDLWTNIYSCVANGSSLPPEPGQDVLDASVAASFESLSNISASHARHNSWHGAASAIRAADTDVRSIYGSSPTPGSEGAMELARIRAASAINSVLALSASASSLHADAEASAAGGFTAAAASAAASLAELDDDGAAHLGDDEISKRPPLVGSGPVSVSAAYATASRDVEAAHALLAGATGGAADSLRAVVSVLRSVCGYNGSLLGVTTRDTTVMDALRQLKRIAGSVETASHPSSAGAAAGAAASSPRPTPILTAHQLATLRLNIAAATAASNPEAGSGLCRAALRAFLSTSSASSGASSHSPEWRLDGVVGQLVSLMFVAPAAKLAASARIGANGAALQPLAGGARVDASKGGEAIRRERRAAAAAAAAAAEADARRGPARVALRRLEVRLAFAVAALCVGKVAGFDAADGGDADEGGAAAKPSSSRVPVARVSVTPAFVAEISCALAQLALWSSTATPPLGLEKDHTLSAVLAAFNASFAAAAQGDKAGAPAGAAAAAASVGNVISIATGASTPSCKRVAEYLSVRGDAAVASMFAQPRVVATVVRTLRQGGAAADAAPFVSAALSWQAQATQTEPRAAEDDVRQLVQLEASCAVAPGATTAALLQLHSEVAAATRRGPSKPTDDTLPPPLVALLDDATAKANASDPRLCAQLISAIYRRDPQRAATLAKLGDLPPAATPLEVAMAIGTLAGTPLPRTSAPGGGAGALAGAPAGDEARAAAAAARVKADRLKRRKRLAAKRAEQSTAPPKDWAALVSVGAKGKADKAKAAAKPAPKAKAQPKKK